jgi:hypothetical protein
MVIGPIVGELSEESNYGAQEKHKNRHSITPIRVSRYLVKSCTKQLRTRKIQRQAFLCEKF